MNLLNIALQIADRLPLERLFVKPHSNKKNLEELQAIFKEARAVPASATPKNLSEETHDEYKDLKGHLEPRQQKVHLEIPSTDANGVTTEETVAYQNREIAKNLVVLEKHFAQ